MSDRMNTKFRRLWAKFTNKEYRDAFVASHISTNIASQIFSMREARGWTQKQLADAAGMAQARISLMEDSSYEKMTLTTLKRLASAFDVALIVRFVPYSELLHWATHVTPEHLAVLSFEEDCRIVSSRGATSTASGVVKIKEEPKHQSLEGLSATNIVIFTSKVGASRETCLPVLLDAHPWTDVCNKPPWFKSSERDAGSVSAVKVIEAAWRANSSAATLQGMQGDE